MSATARIEEALQPHPLSLTFPRRPTGQGLEGQALVSSISTFVISGRKRMRTQSVRARTRAYISNGSKMKCDTKIKPLTVYVSEQEIERIRVYETRVRAAR